MSETKETIVFNFFEEYKKYYDRSVQEKDDTEEKGEFYQLGVEIAREAWKRDPRQKDASHYDDKYFDFSE
jgi:hypothetical protein